MTDTKHTPGPWRAKLDMNRRPLVLAQCEGWPMVTAVRGDRRWIGHEANDANARLIAAAPELLAALESIVAALHEPGPVPTRAALDAIAKAKGDDNA